MFHSFSLPSYSSDKPPITFPNVSFPQQDTATQSISTYTSLSNINDAAVMHEKIRIFMESFLSNATLNTTNYEITMTESQAKEFDAFVKSINNTPLDRITFTATKIPDGRFRLSIEHKSMPMSAFIRK